MSRKILLLPGDGIGPEVIAAAWPVLEQALRQQGIAVERSEGLLGGAAIDATGEPLPAATLEAARAADAILMGAVGGPQWDTLPREVRPERGLLALRSGLDLFANLRPALLAPALVNASSLKPELVADLDILIVRELTGGIYFGEPRGIEVRDNQRVGFNTYVYSESEIERIARVAFDAAARRSGRLCSVDKANVLEATVLWREVVSEVAQDYPQVELSHMYVDNAAMQLVRAPKQFDVLVTGNLFGDILSDAAAMLTGSLGMLPSASLNSGRQGLYEPVHGSAPDIAGKDQANPLATILSAAMLCRYSLGCAPAAAAIEQAVAQVLEQGLRTADLYSATDGAERLVGTRAMGAAVLAALEEPATAGA